MEPRKRYLRALAVVWLVALCSLQVQLLGLFGARGIVPIVRTMARLRGGGGPDVTLGQIWRFPTVFWWFTDDLALQCVAGIGIVAALVALVFGSRIALLVCWISYLSFCSVGRPFMSYQWDNLLLEAGLVAVFWARGTVVAWGLTLWLLLRLVFWSGVVKLASGDPTWHTLSALEFHFWTQPLPTWSAWWAHQLPGWLRSIGCAVLFFLELVVPLGLLVPRLRPWAALGIVALMVGIAATGNYGFFQLLTIVLCLTAWHAWPRPWRWRLDLLALPLLLVVLFMNVVHLRSRLGEPADWEVRLARGVAPLRSFNSYGLFARMTTERREIRLEGSMDGRRWLPYVFHHKPDAPERRPGFAGLHMPRLDWQMWFASLGSVRRNAWLVATMERLREGSPEVLGLFAHVPLERPNLVRAVVSDYRFTALGEPGWWRVISAERLYAPVVGRLQGSVEGAPATAGLAVGASRSGKTNDRYIRGR